MKIEEETWLSKEVRFTDQRSNVGLSGQDLLPHTLDVEVNLVPSIQSLESRLAARDKMT